MFELQYFRGRVALSKILLGLGINNGDGIILQAFTCTAVPEAVFSVGAVPVYVDIEGNGVNMSPEKLRDTLVQYSHVKAIIVQHTFGIPAQIDKIYKIAKQYNIPLIEDCAHTFNSSIAGKEVGEWGSASFYSFEWGKPIIAGFGGSLATSNSELNEYLKKDYESLKEPGLIVNIKSAVQIIVFKLFYRPGIYWTLKKLFHFFSKYGFAVGNYSNAVDHKEKEISDDFNLKMPWVNRLWLRYSLSRLNETIKQRKDISDHYFRVFSQVAQGGLVLPNKPDHAEIYYARFPLIVKDKVGLINEAKRLRIEISGWYETPVHPLDGDQLEIVAGYIKKSCPNAEELCGTLVSLPVNSKITKTSVDKYASIIKGFLS